MNIRQFKSTFDPLFIADVQSRIASSSVFTTDEFIKSLLGHIEALAAEGKRFRPYAVMLAYQTETGEYAIPEKLLPLLICIEYFHIFALIHDDVMDKSMMRRGVPTLEKNTKDLLEANGRAGDLDHTALSQAILIGDLVYTWAYANLFSFLNAHASTPKVTAYTLAMIEELVVGQMLDVDMTTRKTSEVSLIEEKMKIKSGNYTFGRPMTIGALVAGSDTDFYERIGSELGSAFQIKDDLLDTRPSSETGKSAFSDIHARAYTLMTHHVESQANDEDKKFIQQMYGNVLSKDDENNIRAIFEKTGAFSFAESEMEKHLHSAREMLNENPKTASNPLWIELIALIASRSN